MNRSELRFSRGAGDGRPPRDRDARATERSILGAFAGALIGAALGAVLALPIGAVVEEISGLNAAGPAWIVACVLFGAIAGAYTGASISFVRAVRRERSRGSGRRARPIDRLRPFEGSRAATRKD